jgi:hypothetical protein
MCHELAEFARYFGGFRVYEHKNVVPCYAVSHDF